MTVWHIEWENSKGCHTIVYACANAIVNHIQYCIRRNWMFRVQTIVDSDEGERYCIFPTTRGKGRRSTFGMEIVEALRIYGAMTPLAVADKIGLEYHSDNIRRETVRQVMYRLRDKGLIEQVPDVKPVKWRVIE